MAQTGLQHMAEDHQKIYADVNSVGLDMSKLLEYQVKQHLTEDAKVGV